jgi:hypothetical protein
MNAIHAGMANGWAGADGQNAVLRGVRGHGAGVVDFADYEPFPEGFRPPPDELTIETT